MKLFKKLALTAALALPVLALAACGSNKSTTQTPKAVKVGIMSTDVEIWKDIQKRLAKEDVKIKLVQFTEYNTPNQALQDGDIQLNSFQHNDFLNTWNKKHNEKLTAIGNTYIGPMRAFSNKIKSLKDLKKGDTVSVPNDVSNEGRALDLLAANGIIKVKDVATPTIHDITENKLDLKITELDSAQTARSLNDVDAAIVNNDIAVAANLKPADAISVEKLSAKSKPWINIIAAKSAADKKNKTYQKIVKAYETQRTAKLLKKYYKGAVIPAW